MREQTPKERAEERLAYTKTLRFQLYMLGVETRRFFHVFVRKLRLFALLDWIETKLPRRPDATQFKLVPLRSGKCMHDVKPNWENVCPDCGMLFVRVVYDDWEKIGKPKFLFRSDVDL